MRQVIYSSAITVLFTCLLFACTSDSNNDQKNTKDTTEQPVATKKDDKKPIEQKTATKETTGRTKGSRREKILALVNNARAKGCNCGNKYYPPAPPVSWNNKLERAAKKHSAFMNRKGRLSHRGKRGSDAGKRLSDEGYNWMSYGENIAEGYANDEAAVRGWLNSYGHCKNIMNPKFKEMGVGMSGKFWTQNFGTRK